VRKPGCLMEAGSEGWAGAALEGQEAAAVLRPLYKDYKYRGGLHPCRGRHGLRGRRTGGGTDRPAPLKLKWATIWAAWSLEGMQLEKSPKGKTLVRRVTQLRPGKEVGFWKVRSQLPKEATAGRRGRWPGDTGSEPEHNTCPKSTHTTHTTHTTEHTHYTHNIHITCPKHIHITHDTTNTTNLIPRTPHVTRSYTCYKPHTAQYIHHVSCTHTHNTYHMDHILYTHTTHNTRVCHITTHHTYTTQTHPYTHYIPD
jgi:hypothetical protein